VMLSPGAFSMTAMTRADLGNVLVVVPISLLAGSILGAVHGFVAGKLTAVQHLAPGKTTVRLSPLHKSSE